jgi:3'-5' exoribonuclease 1
MASSSEKSLGKEKLEEAYDPDWLVGTSAEKSVSRTARTSTNAPKKSDFSHPVYKQLSKINGHVNRMTEDELVSALKDLDLDSRGQKEVLVKRLKSYYKDRNLEKVEASGGLTDEASMQDLTPGEPEAKTAKCKFDYVCVIDYEATCTETKVDDYPHEIIEFPVVLVNMSTLTIVSELFTRDAFYISDIHFIL